MAQTMNFKVIGDNKMNCSGCERSVTATLRELPGVEAVNADHRTQNITVTLGSNEITPDTITSELREIGYEVQPA